MLGLAISAACIGAAFAPGPLDQSKNVIVAHGTRTSDIGTQLVQEKAVYSPFLFRIAALIAGPLKAGEYAIPAKARPIDIARIMHEGISVVHTFTAAEGLTSTEIVKLLMSAPALSGTIPSVPPEGSLLPETYHYTYNDSREGILTRMQKAMREKIRELWAARDKDAPMKSIDEALALASIVEKETGKPSERARIAGVFFNRLRRNMRLQSDPTVIYALTNGKTSLNRPLTHNDLTTPSPINTYTNTGIPPQPICNPGRAALEAVLHPERHNYLYFVANGSGGHVFSSDLEAHNRNVASWRKIESATRP
ncbi:MAG: endolytic transglycosylase MltG [Alphaproteobacteria bacterium]|nr:endolytic transglycosylase MltG [Alphaproteobacteria bacterium]